MSGSSQYLIMLFVFIIIFMISSGSGSGLHRFLSISSRHFLIASVIRFLLISIPGILGIMMAMLYLCVRRFRLYPERRQAGQIPHFCLCLFLQYSKLIPLALGFGLNLLINAWTCASLDGFLDIVWQNMHGLFHVFSGMPLSIAFAYCWGL